MYLKTLKIKDFRNHRDFQKEFGNRIIVLVGPNTVGKTNILEAIRFLSLFKSFRTSAAKDLIHWGQKMARVEGEVDHGQVQSNLVGALMKNEESLPTRREIRLDGSKIPTRQAVGKLLTVLFSPEDIQLVSSGPAKRRRYLDTVLGQLSRRYYESLLGYNHSLEQRNVALSNPTPSAVNQLDAWDEQLAREGSRLIKERSQFLEDINKNIIDCYRGLAGSGKLKISYQPRLAQPGMEALLSLEKLKNLLQQSLQQARENDIRYQTTSIGPHRDDFTFLLNRRPISSYGSRGEWRSAVLSLKIAEKEYIKGVNKIDPVLLLDDVFSELDSNRRDSLSRKIVGNQAFISTTDADTIGPILRREAEIIKLEPNGKP